MTRQRIEQRVKESFPIIGLLETVAYLCYVGQFSASETKGRNSFNFFPVARSQSLCKCIYTYVDQ